MTIEIKKKSSLTQKLVLVLLSLIAIEPACNHLTQQHDTHQPADLFDMSLTELMEIEVESPDELPATDCQMFPPPVITTARNQIKTGVLHRINKLTKHGARPPAIMV